MTHRERLVINISSRLVETGIKAFPPAFPYGGHHEYFRTKIRPDGKHAKQADVATALEAWASEREEDEYVWQAVCGWLLKLFVANPDHKKRLPEDIAAKMEALEWGDIFLHWVRARLNQPE